jgi:cytosolic 5'-nucleotidase 3
MMMKYPSLVASKIALIKSGGPSKLHCIVDFDRTLTHPASETSWGCLKNSDELSDRFHAGTAELYRKYHPIEVDATRPLKERVAAMEEWWDEANKLLLAERVTRETFARMIAKDNHNLYFRDGTHELITRCKELGVPFLIFSAGLGDLIDAAIAPEKEWNVHVISNHLRYNDGDGVACGFLHQNIHTFSKSEVQLPSLHEEWGNDVVERKNVILMGDSIGDKDMAVGVSHDTVLKIAFLNEENMAAKEDYMEAFGKRLCSLWPPANLSFFHYQMWCSSMMRP